MKEVVRQAIEKKTGARGLRSIVEDLLTDLMFDIPDNPDATEVIIDREVVIKKSSPTIVSSNCAA
jgi:ATP-dependent Clp protease ATP-binding subunit ClpX